jgi:type VI secretion system Hcp family effector
MAHYMVIDGIKGNVTNQGFNGAIALKTTAHVSERTVRHKVGSGTREMGTVYLHHLQITKNEDDASALLWQYLYAGKSIPKVEISRCSLTSGKPEWQSKITLKNVMISQMQDQSFADGNGEAITLAFSHIERSYRSQNSSGQWQTPKHTSFDIESAQIG